MALTIKHTKVSTIPDGTDASLVRPSDWNADHSFTGTMDIAQGGTGQTTAAAARNALLPAQTGNAGKVLGTDGTNTSWVVGGGGSTLIGKTDAATPFTTALGGGAGTVITVGTNNTTVGYNAGLVLANGSQNTFIGALAGDAMTSGGLSTAIGYNALGSTTAANNNTVVGNSALSGANNVGGNNTVVGNSAANVLTGGYNVIIGHAAATSATTLSNAVIVGWNNLEGATTAANGTVAIGYLALNSLSTGANNIAIGASAGNGVTTGARNILIGELAGTNIAATNDNVCMGYLAGRLTTGSGNTYIGSQAGDVATSGSQNTSLGLNSLGALTTGSGNTCIGNNAGIVLTTGSNNTLIGNYAGDAVGMSNNFIASDGQGNRKLQVSDVGAFAINGGGYGASGFVLQSAGTGGAPVWANPNVGSVAQFATNVSMLPGISVYFINCTSGNLTATLPSAQLNVGLKITVKRVDQEAGNTLTITSVQGQIEGLATQSIGVSVAVQYCSDGTNWWELANS